MDMPEYGNKQQVEEAIAAQEAVIEMKKAEVGMEFSRLAMIRTMCKHEYSTRYAMGEAYQKCDICGEGR